MIKRMLSLAAISLPIFLASCSNDQSEPSSSRVELEPLEILIDWQAEPTYLGVYFAIEKGYLEEIGFDGSVETSWGANQAISAVAAGRNIIGTASGGATVLGYNNGADVVSLGVLYPKIPTVIYGLSSSDISTPDDIKGKNVGIYPGSITGNEFDAFLLINSMTRDDLNVVSLSGSDLPFLVSGQVDAVLHYTEMSPVLVETSDEIEGNPGSRTFELALSDYGVGGYGLNIIANREAWEDDRDRMIDLRDAIVRGYEYGCANPEEAESFFVAKFPNHTEEYVSQSWSRVCNLIGTTAGNQNAAGWQETIALYRQLDLLTVDVSADDILGQ